VRDTGNARHGEAKAARACGTDIVTAYELHKIDLHAIDMAAFLGRLLGTHSTGPTS